MQEHKTERSHQRERVIRGINNGPSGSSSLFRCARAVILHRSPLEVKSKDRKASEGESWILKIPYVCRS